MPYKDPEQKRRYQREWKALKKAGRTRSNPGGTVTPLLRIRTAEDVLRVLEQALLEVASLNPASAQEKMAKARTVATVAVTVLKALEVGSLEARIEELERLVNEGAKGIC